MDTKKIRKQSDYSNGKIYIIRNKINDLVYIGSTCKTLEERMREHRTYMNYYKCLHLKIYVAMREIGRDNFNIELVENYECENRTQLRNREGYFIKQYNAPLNKNIEGRTAKEYREANKEKLKKWYVDNKEKMKEYYEVNKEKIKARKAEYYTNNKDKKKEYQEANKEQIKARKAEYYIDNKEKLKAQKKEYYENNKDKIKEYREANKDKIKEYYEVNKDKIKEYYEANKEQIKARKRELYKLKSSN